DRVEAVDVQRDHAGGVGLKTQVNQVIHEPGSPQRVIAVWDVLGRGNAHFGFGLLGPLVAPYQAVFQLADGSEILAELVAVAAPQVGLHVPGAVADRVHDAPALAEPVDLGANVIGRAVQKKPGEDLRGSELRGQPCAATGPGDACASRTQCQVAEARLGPDV